jgi:hypothetical protein
MRTHDPVALFLTTGDSWNGVPALAAECGFHSVLAPWHQCEAQHGRVVVRAGEGVHADGRSETLPGATILRPALVAVLGARPTAFARGRALVAAGDALWGHWSRPRPGDVAPTREATARGRTRVACVAYGIVEFRAGATPLRLASPPGVLVAFGRPGAWADEDGAESAKWRKRAGRAFAAALAADASVTADPILHRTVAPCSLKLGSRAEFALADPLCSAGAGVAADVPGWRAAMRAWLLYARRRVARPEPLSVPSLRATRHPIGGWSGAARPPAAVDVPDHELAIDAAAFPELFNTPRFIDTQPAADAAFVYLDAALEPSDPPSGESRIESLQRILCRVRSSASGATDRIERRLVEHGVGRACLVPEIRVQSRPELHDFTVLGVGLTPFSEGGYVEIGRKIDGKASLVRAWHRKAAAERLEAEGCQSGQVVAIIAVGGDEIEMPNGTMSAAALLVRGFRCAYRVKQLDPLVCCLHSIQHTPLVGAYLERRARELRAARGLPPAGGLAEDDALASVLERQAASQESLRELLGTPPAGHGEAADWATLVRRVRLEAIDAYAPVLVSMAKRRLARALAVPDDELAYGDYLDWFAASVGRQVAAWRRLRFLHDYHHPGVSRWSPGYLYTLGENNVTLLAEFPDLDTGVFVDDDAARLDATLQLAADDVALLRQDYALFHQRDVTAAETVVCTLATVLFREDSAAVGSAVARFRRSYADA